jgi:hypothetical protein
MYVHLPSKNILKCGLLLYIIKKLPKVNNTQWCENSHNLVTLLATRLICVPVVCQFANHEEAERASAIFVSGTDVIIKKIYFRRIFRRKNGVLRVQ